MVCLSQTGGFRVKVFVGVLLAALVAVLVIADVPDLTQRVDPVFPGVKFESKKSNPLFPGTYCSAGFAIQYSRSGGSLGFMTASHCTDPGDWPSRVFQPYYDFWSSDNNYAGFTEDRGTEDPTTDLTKPDAAPWWVMNRGVRNDVPTYLCGRSPQWTKPAGIVRESELDNSTGAWKIGFVTGCTGSDSVRVFREPRYPTLFVAELKYVYAEHGDSGGIVFRWVNSNLYIIGTVVGGLPKDQPQYLAFHSAEFELNYYGHYPYLAWP